MIANPLREWMKIRALLVFGKMCEVGNAEWELLFECGKKYKDECDNMLYIDKSY